MVIMSDANHFDSGAIRESVTARNVEVWNPIFSGGMLMQQAGNSA
jgi:hypothetical protein